MQKKSNLRWEDLLFSNRNKAYGAYEIRMSSGRNLLKSLFIVILFVGIGSVVLSFTSKKADPIPANPVIEPLVYELKDLRNKHTKKPIEKTTPAKKPPVVQKKSGTHATPNPVDQPEDEQVVVKNTEITGSNTVTDEHFGVTEGTDQGATFVGTDESGTATPVIQPKQPESKKIFNVRDVTKMAVFPGCESFLGNKDALQACMAKKLKNELGRELADFQDIASRYNLNKAQTRLLFMVDRAGRIVQIKAVQSNSPELSIEAEMALERIARRLNQSGKFIQPAEIDDGVKVNMNFSLPLQFTMNN